MTGTTEGAWILPPLRQGQVADASLVERRARAAGASGSPAPAGETMIGGVRCVAVEPAGGGSGGVLLYLHGGGYRLGSPLAYLDYAASLAEATGWRVVMPFYRLAPEHPFPAALHDAVAVYRALADGRAIVIAGDSAGGGLTAALCQAATAPSRMESRAKRRSWASDRSTCSSWLRRSKSGSGGIAGFWRDPGVTDARSDSARREL